MVITTLPPAVLALTEQEQLAEHYKNKFQIGLKHGEKPRRYSPDERAIIARHYEKVRAHGYHPAAVDKFGRLVYQRVVKSAVQEMLESGLSKI